MVDYSGEGISFGKSAELQTSGPKVSGQCPWQQSSPIVDDPHKA